MKNIRKPHVKRLVFAYLCLMLTLMVLVSSCKMSLASFSDLSLFSYIPPNLELFEQRMLITADNSSIAEELRDFPVLVRLNSGNIDTTRLGSQPDVRFYSEDLGTELAFEIDTWKSSGESLIWVRIPVIPANGNTSFYMYFSPGPGLNLEPAPEDVWTDNFLGVWHLNETGGTAAYAEYQDSSPRGMTGRSGTGNPDYTTFTTPQPSTGRIGGGQFYNNNSGASKSQAGIRVDDFATGDLYPVTFSTWIRIEDILPAGTKPQKEQAIRMGRLFLLGDSYMDGGQLKHKHPMDMRIGEGGHAGTEIKFGDGTPQDNRQVQSIGAFSVDGAGSVLDEWIWYTMTWDGSGSSGDNLRVYINGEFQNITGDNSEGGRKTDPNGVYIGDEGLPLIIGNAPWSNTNGPVATFDEARVSAVVRSEHWISAQYASMNGTYLQYADAEGTRF